MASSGVNRAMREAGWNVRFVTGDAKYPTYFAGIYQNSDSGFVTFGDVRAELSLCFEFPSVVGEPHNDAENSWNHVAFAFVDDPSSGTPSSNPPAWVTTTHADLRVPAPAPDSTGQQRAVKYHIVQHPALCSLPLDASLADHIAAKCARHLARPSRRRHPAYLPCIEVSTDHRLGIMPFRRKKTPGSRSPKKRPASESGSPNKNTTDGVTADEYANAIIPPLTDDIDVDVQKAMRQFRPECLTTSNQCAVSGKGKSWCAGSLVGPGVQACHIVPQHQYYLYPVDVGTGADQEDDLYSSRRLWCAWEDTWSTKNSISMLKHFHEYFDQRLFSINPDTLRIRAFVPFDVILEFDGKVAKVPDGVDRAALQWHWQMTCMENMSARQHSVNISSMSRMLTSGTGTPFSVTADVLATPASAAASNETPDIVREPSRSPHDPYGQSHASVNHLAEHGDFAKGNNLSLTTRHYVDDEEEDHGGARKRMCYSDDWNTHRLDSRVTSRSLCFLANVDLKLRQL